MQGTTAAGQHAQQQPKSSISGMLSDFTKALGKDNT